MTRHADRKARIRARMAQTGEPYSVAADHIDNPPPASPGPPPNVPVEEQGVRALPADATPQQRARAEAVWRPAEADQPCRCSGQCRHGQACEECTGRVVHVDRYPGAMFNLTIWEDEYGCPNCDDYWSTSVTLPEIPWGATVEDGGQQGIQVYPGVRHPNFREIDEDTPEHPVGDGACRGCGGYAFSGLLCDGCRHNGWTDAYGWVEQPTKDDWVPDRDCRDCQGTGRLTNEDGTSSGESCDCLYDPSEEYDYA